MHDQVYITFANDGEYGWNVFDGVYTNLQQLTKAYPEYSFIDADAVTNRMKDATAAGCRGDNLIGAMYDYGFASIHVTIFVYQMNKNIAQQEL